MPGLISLWISSLAQMRLTAIEDFKAYFIFETKTPRIKAVLEPETTIKTNLVEIYNAILHTNFFASEPSGSEEEDF